MHYAQVEEEAAGGRRVLADGPPALQGDCPGPEPGQAVSAARVLSRDAQRPAARAHGQTRGTSGRKKNKQKEKEKEKGGGKGEREREREREREGSG